MEKPKIFKNIQKKVKSFLKRRPHRSFKLTRRRDYNRELRLPGYFAFGKYVWKTMWSNRKMFGLLILFYGILTILMVGIGSQDTYNTLKKTLDSTGSDYFSGGWGEIGKAGLLFISTATGSLSSGLSDVQGVYAIIIGLLSWLTGIWLLRNILAKNKIKFRDGLYSAGAPIVSTFLVTLLFIAQLLPAAISLIAYSAASASGLLESGIAAMLFWIAAGLLIILSLYWITSTFFALIIVTLPGMYPMEAIKTAGDLVVGRRFRILLRLLWMMVVIVLAWSIIMIPLILFDGWIKGLWSVISGVPFIPFVLLIMSAITIIWMLCYVYLLYRKVIDSDDESA